MNKEKIIDIIASIGLVLLGILIGYYMWGKQEPKIVTIPQTVAETQAGVEQTAKATGITLDKSQAKEIAQGIAQAANEKPYKAVTTTVKETPKVIEQERKAAKADMAIVTNPKEPDKAVNIGSYKPDEAVTLNQYNITAHKKQLYGVSYFPRANGKPAMATIDYSIKISKSGKYIGAVAGYNWDSKKVYAGIRYTF